MKVTLHDDHLVITGVHRTDVINISLHAAMKLSEAIVAALDDAPWPPNKGELIGKLKRHGDIIEIFVDLDDSKSVMTIGNLYDEDGALACFENKSIWQSVIDRYPETATEQRTVA